MRLRVSLLVVVVCFMLVSMVFAQDPVKVDPKHYSVVTENDRVRILKVHYGPHEKSVMHFHPDSAAVFLTDGATGVFHLPDGTSQPMPKVKAGDAMYAPAGLHNPENTGDKAFDVIVVELKGKAPAAKPAAAAKK